ncbi:MAG: DUF1330 domain-containing protein [Gammaproteobacteria bacterium]|nr:DUF1330 domain-containing protein [Gammaproteobacteria bacterium]
MIHMIALIRIKNSALFQEYRERVPSTLAPYGGTLQFRANASLTLDDENHLGDFSQVALFEFPSEDACRHWYESDDYHDLLELREQAGQFTILALDA